MILGSALSLLFDRSDARIAPSLELLMTDSTVLSPATPIDGKRVPMVASGFALGFGRPHHSQPIIQVVLA